MPPVSIPYNKMGPTILVIMKVIAMKNLITDCDSLFKGHTPNTSASFHTTIDSTSRTNQNPKTDSEERTEQQPSVTSKMEEGSDSHPIPTESVDSFRLDSTAEAEEREGIKDGDGGSQVTDDDEEFEFAIVSGGTGDLNAADEKFSDVKIRTVYPVFGRDVFFFSGGCGGEENKDGRNKAGRRGPLRSLMIEEEEEKERMIPSCSSSESDELEGLPADSYCVWTPGKAPSPVMKNKSKSTGSSSRRWRLRDLVVGRSNSDGKKFLFLTPSPPQPTPAEEAASSTPSTLPEPKIERNGKKLGKTASAPAYAHRLYYVKEGDTAAISDQKRSFLPYRKDLVGIFSNVNGTSRNFYPF